MAMKLAKLSRPTSFAGLTVDFHQDKSSLHKVTVRCHPKEIKSSVNLEREKSILRFYTFVFCQQDSPTHPKEQVKTEEKEKEEGSKEDSFARFRLKTKPYLCANIQNGSSNVHIWQAYLRAMATVQLFVFV